MSRRDHKAPSLAIAAAFRANHCRVPYGIAPFTREQRREQARKLAKAARRREVTE